ncbi:uncharacterized protein B0H18DRAFT_962430 [Fomitopsis serialis]|uniref:uncharacterized protein n=1 Tax=Fomitopsis serialis TaxID=139415 RepID=UPI00200763A5|nr:uncharacterized protein B0H18DRAFT_962430 [Neoantrodia serialis]KAH9911248.1 hypothetical protein B0H18DRAFT_962430 [Neoantrodia serialis]
MNTRTRSTARQQRTDDGTTAAAAKKKVTKTSQAPRKAPASKSPPKPGKKRGRVTDDEGEDVDEGRFSKKDEQLLKQLELKKRQSEKQKEAKRRSRIQKTATTMTLEEQESDEDAQEDQPKRKKSRNIVPSEDDEDRSATDGKVEGDAAATEDEENESAEEDELERTPPQAQGSRTGGPGRDVKGKGKAMPQDQDVDMREGAHDERMSAPLLSDEEEQGIAHRLGSATTAKAPSKTKTNRHKRTQGKTVGGGDKDASASDASSGRRGDKAKTSTRHRTNKLNSSERKDKVPAWLATSVSEDDAARSDHGDRAVDSGGDGGDESEGGGDDVVLVKAQKGKARQTKPKAAGAARTRGRAQMRDLPDEVRSIVTKAHSYLRLRIALEHAWTWEKMTNSTLLPEKYVLIKRAVNDVRELCDDDGKPLMHFALGFKKLNGDGNDVLRVNVFDVVWTAASQLRNELKNKAKVVVEDAYGLNHLSGPRKVSAASFLLKGNVQGKHTMPNFIFNNISIVWTGDDVDVKASRVNRKQPFQHKAIFQLIAAQWFYAGQRDSVIKESQGRFAEVPDNLLALVCNAIEMGLADVATGTQQFTNRVYAPKWVNIIGVLRDMKDKAPNAYVALRHYVWANVSELIRKDEEAGKKGALTLGVGDEADDEEFVAWDDIEVVDLTAEHSGEASSSATRGIIDGGNNGMVDGPGELIMPLPASVTGK